MVLMSSKPSEDFDRVLNAQVEGVQIDGVVEDKSPFQMVYNPSHPDADENGNLFKPNIDLIVEMTNMVMARRAFEANLSAIKSTRQMAIKALEIGR